MAAAAATIAKARCSIGTGTILTFRESCVLRVPCADCWGDRALALLIHRRKPRIYIDRAI